MRLEENPPHFLVYAHEILMTQGDGGSGMCLSTWKKLYAYIMYVYVAKCT